MLPNQAYDTRLDKGFIMANTVKVHLTDEVSFLNTIRDDSHGNGFLP